MSLPFIRHSFYTALLLVSINFIIIASFSIFNSYAETGKNPSFVMPELILSLMAYFTFALLTWWFHKPGLSIKSSASCIFLMLFAYLFFLLAGQLLITKTFQNITTFNYFLNIQTLKLISVPILISILSGACIGAKTRYQSHVDESSPSKKPQ